jgi:hypothetical protein
MKMNHRYIFCLVAAAVLVAAGCSQSESTPTQAAAAEPQPAPPAQAPAPPAALPPGHPNIDMSTQALPAASMAQAANPQWEVPKDWQPGPASSVRHGSWTVQNADGQSVDIAVTTFPGDVRGLLANVNRWRSQIGMQPVTPDEVASITSDMDVNGQKATVVDFSSGEPAGNLTNPQRVVAVILMHDGDTWFFKMTGSAPLVAAQKDVLLQFVKSVKF